MSFQNNSCKRRRQLSSNEEAEVEKEKKHVRVRFKQRKVTTDAAEAEIYCSPQLESSSKFLLVKTLPAW